MPVVYDDRAPNTLGDIITENWKVYMKVIKAFRAAKQRHLLYIVQEILVPKFPSQQESRDVRREAHYGCQDADIIFTHPVAETCHA